MLSSKPVNVLEEHYHVSDLEECIFTNCIITDDCYIQPDQNLSLDQIPENCIYIISPLSNSDCILPDVLPSQTTSGNAPALEKLTDSLPVPDAGHLSIQPKPIPQQYKCIKCESIFNSQQKYHKHLISHKYKKKFQCTVCSLGFNVENNLKVHMILAHESGEDRCPVCGITLTFQRVASLKSHLMLHQVEETSVCRLCNVEFDKEEAYVKHMEKHTSNSKSSASKKSDVIACGYCRIEFANYKEYKRHLTEHAKLNRLFFRKRNTHSKNSTTNKGHVCNTCGKGFIKRSLLLRHERVHSGEKPYKCNICDRGFTQKGSLLIHARMHEGLRPYSCTLCPAKFRQLGGLRVHVRKTHYAPSDARPQHQEGDPKRSRQPLKCPYCACVFKRVATLNGHVTRTHSKQPENEQTNEEERTMHDVLMKLKKLNQIAGNIVEEDARDESGYITLTEKPPADSSLQQRLYSVRYKIMEGTRWYICEAVKCCRKKFKKPSDLIRHMRIHSKEKPFKCTKCNSSFSLKSSLDYHEGMHAKRKNHLLSKTSETSRPCSKPHRCGDCNKTFSSVAQLRRHQENKKEGTNGAIENAIPELVNQQEQQLVAKVDLKNRIDRNVDFDLMGEVTIVCMNCETDFRGLEYFQNHTCGDGCEKVDDSTPNNSDDRQVIKDVENPRKTDAESKKNLEVVVEENNDLNQERNVIEAQKITKNTCVFCGKYFRKPSDLTRHHRTHTGERPYECTTCGKKFTLKSTLQSHLRRHDPLEEANRKVACDVCGSYFSSKSSLKVHMTIHTGQKSHNCTFCNLTFRTVSNKKSHELLKHLKVKRNGSTERTDSKKQKITDILETVTMEWLGNARDEHNVQHTNNSVGNLGSDVLKETFTGTSVHQQSLDEQLSAATVALQGAQEEQQQQNIYLEPATENGGALSQYQFIPFGDTPIIFDDIALLDFGVTGDLQVVTLPKDTSSQPQSTIAEQDDLQQQPVHLLPSKPHCDICNKSYSSRSTFRRHQRVVHDRKVSESGGRKDPCKPGDRPFECPKCSNKFATENGLKTHLKRIHGDTVISDETLDAWLNMGITFQKDC